jgi:hypothetical protein
LCKQEATNLVELTSGPVRRMQFTQERATTKKIPLNTDGLGVTLTIDALLNLKSESALITFLGEV